MTAEPRRDFSTPGTQRLFPEEAISPLRIATFTADQGTQLPAPAPSQPEFSSDWTLTDFVERQVIPFDKPAKRTADRWRDSLAHWRRITGNPPIKSIGQPTVDRFVEILATLTIASNTQRTHCAQISGFLNRLAQPSKRHRRAVGFFTQSPWFDPPPLEIIEGAMKHFTLAELGRYLECCSSPPPPRKWLPAPWPLLCESVALVAYNTGLRISEVLAMRFEWLDGAGETHWINMPAAAMKRGKKTGRGRRVALNEWALAAIARLEPYMIDLGAIFGGAAHCSRFNRARKAIVEKAGLPDQKRFGFHGFRQAGKFYLSRINPRVTKLFLGHAGGADVTSDFYTSFEELCEALAKLPQPKWTAWSGDAQLRLFE